MISDGLDSNVSPLADGTSGFLDEPTDGASPSTGAERADRPFPSVEEKPAVQALPEDSKGTRRSFTGYALALVAFVAVASALHWSWYPLFVDTYYHMGVIQGLEQAGGLPTWAFWEMAPGGRVHIYPPAIHVVGYLTTFLGITPEAFVTFLSWFLYPASLLTTWLWLRRVFGARPALIAVILLCGPQAYFWTQTTFTASAFAITVAPLALLALESERFLACGALNLLAATAHPMGLFLPPALFINTLLRRKKLLAGLLAACVPMLLYGPWLAHIWANRAFLPEERTGGDVSLSGFGAGGALNLGLALGAAAIVGIPWILARRREALGLIGPALGFAVVWPMGFGGRFLQFNIHWPLAAIGGFGVGMLLECLDRGAPWRRSLVRVASVGLAFLALSTWAAFELRLPRGLPGGPGRADAPGLAEKRGGQGPRSPMPGPDAFSWSFQTGPTALAKLLDPDSQPAPFGGGGGPGPGGGRRGDRQLGDRGPDVRGDRGPEDRGDRRVGDRARRDPAMRPGGPIDGGPDGREPRDREPGGFRPDELGPGGPTFPGGPEDRAPEDRAPEDRGPRGREGAPDDRQSRRQPDDRAPGSFRASDRGPGGGMPGALFADRSSETSPGEAAPGGSRSGGGTDRFGQGRGDDRLAPGRGVDRLGQGRQSGRRGPFQGGPPGAPLGRGGGGGPGGGGPGGPGGDLIHREGAREFFEATIRLVAPGEVICLQDPMAASLLTGVTGRWTSSGILRDVRSAERQAKPADCQFLARIGGGFMGGGFMGGGPAGPGASDGLQGFEKVFENSFGSLWKNPAVVSRAEPAKAAVPLAGLAIIAGLGLLISLLDLLLPRDRARARLLLGAAAFVAAAACLAPLAWTAAGELLHPPEAPSRDAGMPFGGPPPGGGPPGFGPGGPGPGGQPFDVDIPENLRERYDRMHQAISETLGSGGDPRSFWAPEDEMELRGLIQSGRSTEAERLLDQAMERLRATEGRKEEGREGEEKEVIEEKRGGDVPERREDPEIQEKPRTQEEQGIGEKGEKGEKQENQEKPETQEKQGIEENVETEQKLEAQDRQGIGEKQ